MFERFDFALAVTIVGAFVLFLVYCFLEAVAPWWGWIFVHMTMHTWTATGHDPNLYASTALGIACHWALVGAGGFIVLSLIGMVLEKPAFCLMGAWMESRRRRGLEPTSEEYSQRVLENLRYALCSARAAMIQTKLDNDSQLEAVWERLCTQSREAIASHSAGNYLGATTMAEQTNRDARTLEAAVRLPSNLNTYRIALALQPA